MLRTHMSIGLRDQEDVQNPDDKILNFPTAGQMPKFELFEMR